jgi:hypothetical protein
MKEVYSGQIKSEDYSLNNVSWRLGYQENDEKYPVFIASSLSSFCDLTDHIRTAWSRKVIERMKGEQTYNGVKRGNVGEILPWFRGVRNKNYTLTPMLAREWIDYRDQYDSIGHLEDYYFDRFTRFGRPFLGGVIPNDIIEWNYIMRHHDIPSRLLDWTKGSLIALSYATMRSLEPDRRISSNTAIDAAVWMLEPRRLMEVATECLPTSSFGSRNIPTRGDEIRAKRRDFFLVDPLNENRALTRPTIIEERTNLKWVKNHPDKSKEYWKYPLPLIPSHISARVGSHLSRFTLHSLEGFWGENQQTEDDGLVNFSTKAFEDTKDKYWYLIKIELPGVHLPEIARGLRMTGVGDMNFTQDLDGLSRELRMRADLGLKDDTPIPPKMI